MTLLDDGSYKYKFDELPWHSFINSPGDYMKILHVDEEMGQVVYVQRFAKGAKHLQHTHHCTAIAYTLSGSWQYDKISFGPNELAFEPAGSKHSPSTHEGETADVLVILTSAKRDGRLLELYGENGETFELNVDVFKLMASMTPEEFIEFQKQNPHE